MIDYFYRPEFWTWEWSLASIALQSFMLPLIVGLLFWHLHHKVHLRVLAFVVYSLVMDHLAGDADTKYLFHPNTNSPWYHLLVPGLFFLMTRFFVDYLQTLGYGWLSRALPLGFTVLVAINAFVGDGFYNFPSRVVALYSLTGIALSIGYFVFLLGTLTEVYLERQPMFWIAAGLLIYFASNFLVWLGLNYLVGDRDLFHSVYRINKGATILLSIFFTIAVLLNPTTSKTSSPYT